jgi:hypothetical protein
MPKFLRPFFVILLFAATTLYAYPRPVFIPMCYTLPTCTFSSGTWHYSHQCYQGTQTLYVYINETDDWCLYGPIMP